MTFLRNSGPGNIQTSGILFSHQNLTRCNRGNWKIEKKNCCYQIFPLKILIRNLVDKFFFFPIGLVCDLTKIVKSQFFCPVDQVTSSTRGFGLGNKKLTKRNVL